MVSARAIDRAFKALLILLVLATLGITLGVVFLLLKESSGFFSMVRWDDFLLGLRWAPLLEPKHFGVWPLVSGTMMVALGAILIAVPAGIMAAVYTGLAVCTACR